MRDFAHRIRQHSHLLAALRHLLDHLVAQGQTVDKRGFQPRFARGVQIAQVGVLQLRAVGANSGSQRGQRLVLRRRSGPRHAA
jgi:hypothetical protein